MNVIEITHRFLRAAEIDRNIHEHVGPMPLRAQQLPYVHSYADKAGWRKEPGDKLEKGADPLTEERQAFWERMGTIATLQDMRDLDSIYDLLLLADTDEDRRALLAWARAKAGGKAFRRWCFQVEGIHPETGRRRKNRAIARIHAQLNGSVVQHCDNGPRGLLPCGPEFGDVSGTLEEDVGKREQLNSWRSDSSLSRVTGEKADFAWAKKRWAMRRRREAQKAQKQV